MQELAQLALTITTAESQQNMLLLRERVVAATDAVVQHEQVQQRVEAASQQAAAATAAATDAVIQQDQAQRRGEASAQRYVVALQSLSQHSADLARANREAAASQQQLAARVGELEAANLAAAETQEKLTERLNELEQANTRVAKSHRDAGREMVNTKDIAQSLFFSFNGLAGSAFGVNQSVSDLFARLAQAAVGTTWTAGILVGVTLIGHAIEALGNESSETAEQAKKALQELSSLLDVKGVAHIQLQIDVESDQLDQLRAKLEHDDWWRRLLGIDAASQGRQRTGILPLPFIDTSQPNGSRLGFFDPIGSLQNYLATQREQSLTGDIAKGENALTAGEDEKRNQGLKEYIDLQKQRIDTETKLVATGLATAKVQRDARADLDLYRQNVKELTATLDRAPAATQPALRSLIAEYDDTAKSLAGAFETATHAQDAELRKQQEAERKHQEALKRAAEEDVRALKYRQKGYEDFRAAVEKAMAGADVIIDRQLAAAKAEREAQATVVDRLSFAPNTFDDAFRAGDAIDLGALRRDADAATAVREFSDLLHQGTRQALVGAIEEAFSDPQHAAQHFAQSFAQVIERSLAEAISTRFSAQLDALLRGRTGAALSTAAVGGVVGYDVGSTTSSSGLGALGGAASGAAAGAVLGSVVPVIGTAIGAVVGGLTGAIGGLIGSHQHAKQAAEAMARAQEQLAAIQAQQAAQRATSIMDLGADLTRREFALSGNGSGLQTVDRNASLAKAFADALTAGASDEMLTRLEAVTRAEWARADALAAQQRADQHTGFANSVAGLAAQAMGDDRTTFILGITEQARQTALGFTDLARQGVISFEELTAGLGLLNAATAKQIADYDRQVQQQHDAALGDAQVRLLTAQGQSTAADTLRIQLQYERELDDARKQGADVLAAVTAAQQAETNARQRALAIQARTDQAGFSAQVATLEGRDRDAYWIQQREQVQQQVDTYARLRDAGTITGAEFDHISTLLQNQLTPAAREAADALDALQKHLANLSSASSEAQNYFKYTGATNQDQASYFANLYGFNGLTRDQVVATLHAPTTNADQPLSGEDLAYNQKAYNYLGILDTLLPTMTAAMTATHTQQSASASFFSGATAAQIDRYGDIALTQLSVEREQLAVLRALAGGQGASVGASTNVLRVEVVDQSPDGSRFDDAALDTLANGIARRLGPNSRLTVAVSRAVQARGANRAYRAGDSDVS